MKKLYFLLLLVAGCQSTTINNQQYKVSKSTTELGSIGQAGSSYIINNNFSPFAFPQLSNKIRLDAHILPFNKKLYKIYNDKIKTRRSDFKITYADSLEKKAEYVVFDVLDRDGLLQEYNADYNKDVVNYLKNTKKAVVVTGVAVAIDEAAIQKISQSDAYYLINRQDNKYTVALYKEGKKTEEIDLHNGINLSYRLGKFCWAIDERNKWYIADITDHKNSCKGTTLKNIKKKEERNLFNM